MSEPKTVRALALGEAMRALIDVAKEDFSQGKGVQNIICLVLDAAITRLKTLGDLPPSLVAVDRAVLQSVRAELLTGDERADIGAPEDPEVLALCERLGFGAVMDSAARQWRKRDPVGAFAVGSCLGLIRRALAALDAAVAK